MDIFEKLRQEHRKVSATMGEIEKSEDSATKQELFQKMKAEMTRHAEAEDESFYAFLAGFDEMEDIIAEAREDHQTIEAMMQEIEALPPESDAWSSRFEELMEIVDDHIAQEESEIFEDARELIDSQRSDELARRMQARKESSQSLF